MTRLVPTSLSLAATLGLLIPSLPASASVEIAEQPDRLEISIDGQPFAEYRFATNASRPSLFPVLGPDDVRMTRSWPIAEGPNEAHDHPHHRSLWFAHGDINGIDFWAEGSGKGRTVHQEFRRVRGGDRGGIIQSVNLLVGPDDKTVGTVECTLRIGASTSPRILDFDTVIHASHGPLTIGDTKEGTLAIRLAETMRLKPNEFNAGKATGHIVNSEGARDGETWGHRAAWVDYHGPIDGRTMGVAIFDHPSNPRHPTWWHVRDYGLFAANPFGIHDFERLPAGAGKVVLPEGGKYSFRHRFVFHIGTERDADIARLYSEYLKETP